MIYLATRDGVRLRKPLLAMSDYEFAIAFIMMPAEEFAALPADVLALCRKRYAPMRLLRDISTDSNARSRR